MTTTAKTKELQKFADKFWADQEERAKAAGMNVIKYLAQVENGMLRPTIAKMLLHSKAHPDTCPADCAFQASIAKLKSHYGNQ